MLNLNALIEIPFVKEVGFLHYDGMKGISLAKPMEEVTKAIKKHQICGIDVSLILDPPNRRCRHLVRSDVSRARDEATSGLRDLDGCSYSLVWMVYRPLTYPMLYKARHNRSTHPNSH
jgi:hypothetical protein